MGVCDYVTLEGEYPACGLSRGSSCQTKNLWATGSEFKITADGKLVELLYRYERSPEQGPRNRPVFDKRIPVGERVIDYHGDLLLSHVTADRAFREVVARFTHGCLEWILPIKEYPEANRILLTEQGVR